jgi:hypothetical protein
VTLLVLPDQGFAYIPPEVGTPTTPQEKLTYARGLIAQAAVEAEEWLVANGFPPYELAPIDIPTRCVIGYWVDNVGATGPDYPGATLVAYVNIPPPGPPDVPPPPPPVEPVDPAPVPVEP